MQDINLTISRGGINVCFHKNYTHQEGPQTNSSNFTSLNQTLHRDGQSNQSKLRLVLSPNTSFNKMAPINQEETSIQISHQRNAIDQNPSTDNSENDDIFKRIWNTESEYYGDSEHRTSDTYLSEMQISDMSSEYEADIEDLETENSQESPKWEERCLTALNDLLNKKKGANRKDSQTKIPISIKNYFTNNYNRSNVSALVSSHCNKILRKVMKEKRTKETLQHREKRESDSLPHFSLILPLLDHEEEKETIDNAKKFKRCWSDKNHLNSPYYNPSNRRSVYRHTDYDDYEQTDTSHKIWNRPQYALHTHSKPIIKPIHSRPNIPSALKGSIKPNLLKGQNKKYNLIHQNPLSATYGHKNMFLKKTLGEHIYDEKDYDYLPTEYSSQMDPLDCLEKLKESLKRQQKHPNYSIHNSKVHFLPRLHTNTKHNLNSTNMNSPMSYLNNYEDINYSITNSDYEETLDKSNYNEQNVGFGDNSGQQNLNLQEKENLSINHKIHHKFHQSLHEPLIQSENKSGYYGSSINGSMGEEEEKGNTKHSAVLSKRYRSEEKENKMKIGPNTELDVNEKSQLFYSANQHNKTLRVIDAKKETALSPPTNDSDFINVMPIFQSTPSNKVNHAIFPARNTKSSEMQIQSPLELPNHEWVQGSSNIFNPINMRELYKNLPKDYEFSAGQWIHIQPVKHIFNPEARASNSELSGNGNSQHKSRNNDPINDNEQRLQTPTSTYKYANSKNSGNILFTPSENINQVQISDTSFSHFYIPNTEDKQERTSRMYTLKNNEITSTGQPVKDSFTEDTNDILGLNKKNEGFTKQNEVWQSKTHQQDTSSSILKLKTNESYRESQSEFPHQEPTTKGSTTLYFDQQNVSEKKMQSLQTQICEEKTQHLSTINTYSSTTNMPESWHNEIYGNEIYSENNMPWHEERSISTTTLSPHLLDSDKNLLFDKTKFRSNNLDDILPTTKQDFSTTSYIIEQQTLYPTVEKSQGLSFQESESKQIKDMVENQRIQTSCKKSFIDEQSQNIHATKDNFKYKQLFEDNEDSEAKLSSGTSIKRIHGETAFPSNLIHPTTNSIISGHSFTSQNNIGNNLKHKIMPFTNSVTYSAFGSQDLTTDFTSSVYNNNNSNSLSNEVNEQSTTTSSLNPYIPEYRSQDLDNDNNVGNQYSVQNEKSRSQQLFDTYATTTSQEHISAETGNDLCGSTPNPIETLSSKDISIKGNTISEKILQSSEQKEFQSTTTDNLDFSYAFTEDNGKNDGIYTSYTLNTENQPYSIEHLYFAKSSINKPHYKTISDDRENKYFSLTATPIPNEPMETTNPQVNDFTTPSESTSIIENETKMDASEKIKTMNSKSKKYKNILNPIYEETASHESLKNIDKNSSVIVLHDNLNKFESDSQIQESTDSQQNGTSDDISQLPTISSDTLGTSSKVDNGTVTSSMVLFPVPSNPNDADEITVEKSSASVISPQDRDMLDKVESTINYSPKFSKKSLDQSQSKSESLKLNPQNRQFQQDNQKYFHDSNDFTGRSRNEDEQLEKASKSNNEYDYSALEKDEKKKHLDISEKSQNVPEKLTINYHPKLTSMRIGEITTSKTSLKNTYSTDITNEKPEYTGSLLLLNPYNGEVTQTIAVTGKLLTETSKFMSIVPNFPFYHGPSYHPNAPIQFIPMSSILPHEEQVKDTNKLNNEQGFTYSDGEVLTTFQPKPLSFTEENELNNMLSGNNVMRAANSDVLPPLNTLNSNQSAVQNITSELNVQLNHHLVEYREKPSLQSSSVLTAIYNPTESSRKIFLPSQSPSLLTAIQHNSSCESAYKQYVYKYFLRVLLTQYLNELKNNSNKNCSSNCNDEVPQVCNECIKQLIMEQKQDENNLAQKIRSYNTQHCQEQLINNNTNMTENHPCNIYSNCKLSVISYVLENIGKWLRDI